MAMASRASSTPFPEAPKESVVARLLIAPITFVSFLISLALIDNRNASFRQHLHAASYSPASDSIYGRVKNTLHNWVYRPQPYTYVTSPDVLQRQKSGEIVKEQNANEDAWHFTTKQKMMMKMEIADAFEIRKRVVLAMAVAVAVFAALAVWFVNWSYGLVKSYM